MKRIRLIIAILIVVTTVLSLTDIVNSKIVTPILFGLVSVILFISSYESYTLNKKSVAIFVLTVAIMMILTAGVNFYSALK